MDLDQDYESFSMLSNLEVLLCQRRLKPLPRLLLSSKISAEGNKEYSSHDRTLILQESDRDNTLTVIRQNAEGERILIKVGKTANLFASEDANKQAFDPKVFIASEKDDEDLKAVWAARSLSTPQASFAAFTLEALATSEST
jgi:hypothetical protein